MPRLESILKLLPYTRESLDYAFPKIIVTVQSPMGRVIMGLFYFHLRPYIGRISVNYKQIVYSIHNMSLLVSNYTFRLFTFNLESINHGCYMRGLYVGPAFVSYCIVIGFGVLCKQTGLVYLPGCQLGTNRTRHPVMACTTAQDRFHGSTSSRRTGPCQ